MRCACAYCCETVDILSLYLHSGSKTRLYKCVYFLQHNFCLIFNGVENFLNSNSRSSWKHSTAHLSPRPSHIFRGHYYHFLHMEPFKQTYHGPSPSERRKWAFLPRLRWVDPLSILRKDIAKVGKVVINEDTTKEGKELSSDNWRNRGDKTLKVSWQKKEIMPVRSTGQQDPNSLVHGPYNFSFFYKSDFSKRLSSIKEIQIFDFYFWQNALLLIGNSNFQIKNRSFILHIRVKRSLTIILNKVNSNAI